MDIFENLENLNISEECFNEIMDIVEEIISERNKENKEAKKEWEKEGATNLKVKRTLDSETIRQLELNDPGSVKRMKEGTKKNLLGSNDIKAFRDENKKVSEECFDEIMGLVEEIINEVSVNMWKKAAINSLAKRGFEEGRMDADITALCKKKRWSNKDEEKLDKHFNALDRTAHAEEVANLPNSNMSANKVLGAARKAEYPRVKARHKEKLDHKPNRVRETLKRLNHASRLIPVLKDSFRGL